uniref:Uncharacterized protein n=1 Tax=Ixodes ricinus TaxID=34613 RepID=A0A6B0US64_IXORI
MSWMKLPGSRNPFTSVVSSFLWCTSVSVTLSGKKTHSTGIGVRGPLPSTSIIIDFLCSFGFFFIWYASQDSGCSERWQTAPAYPVSVQLHTNSAESCLHTPPCSHGFGWHLSIIWQALRSSCPCFRSEVRDPASM